MEKLYTVNKNKTRADCGSDHELLISKFRLKLKKVGKTARPFKYDLNQIPLKTWMTLNLIHTFRWSTITVMGFWEPCTFTVQPLGENQCLFHQLGNIQVYFSHKSRAQSR